MFFDSRGRIYPMGIPSIQGTEFEKAFLISGIGRKNLTPQYALRLILNNDPKLIQPYENHISDTSSEAYLHGLLVEDLVNNVLSYKQVSLLLIPKTLHSHLLISYDAHASAYQHISIITCDQKLAKIVNILPNKQQNDLYSLYLSQLKDSVSKSSFPFDDDIKLAFLNQINRRLIKCVLMPYFYGKTVFSFSKDVFSHFDGLFSIKESFKIGKMIHDDFKSSPYIKRALNFQTLLLSKEVVSIKKSFTFISPIWQCEQTYLNWTTVQVRVYKVDRITRERKLFKISMQIPSKNYSNLRSKNAVTANFIHFCDGFVCSKMIPHSYATIHHCFMQRIGAITPTKLSHFYREHMLSVHEIALKTIHYNLLKILENHEAQRIEDLLVRLENALYTENAQEHEITSRIQGLKEIVAKFSIPLRLKTPLYNYWDTLIDYPSMKRGLTQVPKTPANLPLVVSWD